MERDSLRDVGWTVRDVSGYNPTSETGAREGSAGWRSWRRPCRHFTARERANRVAGRSQPARTRRGPRHPPRPHARRHSPPDRDPRSQEPALLARRAKAVPRGVPAVTPIAVVHAEGAVLTDADGNRLIDFGGGIGVVNTGHRHPGVVEAVREQLDRFAHVCFPVSTYEPYVELAERLNRLTPGHAREADLLRQQRRGGGGERGQGGPLLHRPAGDRLLRARLPRPHQPRHGAHLQGDALQEGIRAVRARRCTGSRIPTATAAPEGPAGGRCCLADRARLEQILAAIVDPGSVAAIIMELELGEGGFVPAPVEYVQTLAAFAKQHGILFIADEIQTGFGRTGKLFASEHYGLVPDLMTTAKSLAGGLPLAAVTGRADVHGGAARGRARRHLRRESAGLRRGAGRARRHGGGADPGPRPAHRRPGQGAVPAVGRAVLLHRRRPRARRDGRDGAGHRPRDQGPDKALTGRVLAAALERGLVLLSAGTFGNMVRVLAPLTADDAVIDEGLDVDGGGARGRRGVGPRRSHDLDRARLAALLAEEERRFTRPTPVRSPCSSGPAARCSAASRCTGWCAGPAASRCSSRAARARTSPTSTAPLPRSLPGRHRRHDRPRAAGHRDGGRAPGGARLHLHAAHGGRGLGRRGAGPPLRPSLLAVRRHRHRRQPLRPPARPRRSPAGRRSWSSTGATTARWTKPSPRSQDGRTVARDGNLGPPVDPALTTRVVEFNDLPALEAALAPRGRRVRAGGAGADQRRHRAPRAGISRRAPRAYPPGRDAAHHRRDPHHLRRARRVYPGPRARARHADAREAGGRRRAGRGVRIQRGRRRRIQARSRLDDRGHRRDRRHARGQRARHRRDARHARARADRGELRAGRSRWPSGSRGAWRRSSRRSGCPGS